jgi:hypothetical protein
MPRIFNPPQQILVINVPPKIWRPKVKSVYTPIDTCDDIDDGIFAFEKLGKCVFKPNASASRKDIPQRDDLIFFDDAKDKEELFTNFKHGTAASSEDIQAIVTIIQQYWDCFCNDGAKRTILGYEFAIDTGNHTPVCCKKPQYGPHESRIIMDNIETLKHNSWIKECAGPWGSIIVLAPKPHQEHVNDISDFVWRMCVSYRKLNSITKPFQYPIPRCDDAIDILGACIGDVIYFIALDAKQGYHQVAVKSSDMEKLAFFGPDNKKYCFTVMPFGPTNAPAFYTCMMNQFKLEWDELFLTKLQQLPEFCKFALSWGEFNVIHVGSKMQLTMGSKVIIDDILLFGNSTKYLILYFECVCQVFQKYRVSFQLKKCEFFKDRIEYVGHDLRPKGNSPAASKFDLINDWPLPTSGQSLHSLIGLVNYYHRYIPYFEIIIKPLRTLERKYRRTNIPLMAWSPDLITLFNEVKVMVTSSPVLARYNPKLPTFLKTDWSALGMGWILMQPDDSKESLSALETLNSTGEVLFDVTMDGPRLRPIAFGSRACTDTEKHFHSFVGEIASGRYGIAQNKKYLWGAHFYWLCDCNSIKEVLEYTGPIHMICRWSQELLGYQFTIIHRPAKMMADVDALNRRFSSDLAQYTCIASILRASDIQQRPSAYTGQSFSNHPTKHHPIASSASHLPILTKDTIHHLAMTPIESAAAHTATPNIFAISCTPAHYHTSLTPITSNPQQPSISTSNNISTELSNLNTSITWLSYDNTLGSSKIWFQSSVEASFTFNIHFLFSQPQLQSLFQHLHPTETSDLLPLHSAPHNTFGADFHYFQQSSENIFQWLQEIAIISNRLQMNSDKFCCINIWINSQFFKSSSATDYLKLIYEVINTNNDWTHTIDKIVTSDFGDAVAAERVIITFCLIDKFTTSTLAIPSINDIETSICINSRLHHHYITDAIEKQLQIPVNIPLNIIESLTSTESLRKPTVLATINDNSINNNVNYSASSGIILHPNYPSIEPSIHRRNNVTLHSFCIISWSIFQKCWIVRRLLPDEILSLYLHGPSHNANTARLSHHLSMLLDVLLPFSSPVYSFIHYFNHRISTLINDCLLYGDDVHNDCAKCFVIQPVPTTNDWEHAYLSDPNLSTIFQEIQINSQTSTWASTLIKSVPPFYQDMLLQNHICLNNKRLVYMKPISLTNKSLSLIIVPASMRRTIFEHYHGSPSGAHMGEYKTLHRMRLRFIWPKMRQHIKDWTAQCAQCIACNAWRTRRSELYFSWPVTVPFWIMHVDLWQPGKVCDKNGNNYCLNSMCDLSQFVVSSVTKDITARGLADLYMAEVILKYGISAVIVIDDGSPFKGMFSDMCKILNVTLWPLSRGNHKGLSVERYHRFLNKTQAIAGHSVGTHEVFSRNVRLSAYAWNSAPIDGTDIIRSFVAVGHDFRFPFDVNFSNTPSLNVDNAELFSYLRSMGQDSQFATHTLQILIEDRREAHRLRVNKLRNTDCGLKVGDVVKAHVQVQSDVSKGEVKKLSYSARGPFTIIDNLGHGSFLVQPYNKPNAATRKYKATELYLLPPALYPSNPYDTIDQRYLNYEHAPILSPLAKSLNIEEYNSQWFENHPKFEQIAPKPATDTIQLPLQFPKNEELHKETCSVPPIPEIDSNLIKHSLQSLYHGIAKSKDKLFFITYTPANTLTAKWFLVQLEEDLTTQLRAATHNSNTQPSSIFVCSFLARHPDDCKKSDPRSRWWPDWYSYSTCPKTQEIVYKQRKLFQPSATPNPSKYILWQDTIDLIENTLLGPFNFAPITATQRTRNIVPHILWHSLHSICLSRNLHPPSLYGPQHTQHHINKKRKQPK